MNTHAHPLCLRDPSPASWPPRSVSDAHRPRSAAGRPCPWLSLRPKGRTSSRRGPCSAWPKGGLVGGTWDDLGSLSGYP